MTDEPRDPYVGTEIGGCRVERPIGRGGMGAVYLATHLGLGIPVAIKVLRVDKDREEERVERFLREARVLAQLNHPNIVRIHDAGEGGGNFYLVLEYVEGESLSNRFSRTGELDWVEAAYVARETAVGLDQVHARRILHRDVKAANIFLGPDEHGLPSSVKLGDFGLALVEETNRRLTSAGKVVGTIQYLSPEQVQGEPASPATDLYSLGVVLYRVLSAEWPHPGRDSGAILRHIAKKDPVPLDRHVSGLPPALVRLVDDLLARDPVRRGTLASDVAARIDDILRREAVRPIPPLELAGPTLIQTDVSSLAVPLVASTDSGEAPTAAPPRRPPTPPGRRREPPSALRVRRAQRAEMTPGRILFLIVAGVVGPFLFFFTLWAIFGDDGPPSPPPVTRTTPPPRPRPDPPPRRDPDPTPPPPVVPVAGDPETVWLYVESLRAAGAPDAEDRARDALSRLLVRPALERTRRLAHEARTTPAERELKLVEAFGLLDRLENPPLGRVLPEDLKTAVELERQRLQELSGG